MVLIKFSQYITVSAKEGLTYEKTPLHWRHNGRDGVWNHRRLDCLLNRLFKRRSKNTSKLCVTGICEVNPVKGGFPTQRASNAENASIWRRHYAFTACVTYEFCVKMTWSQDEELHSKYDGDMDTL